MPPESLPPLQSAPQICPPITTAALLINFSRRGEAAATSHILAALLVLPIPILRNPGAVLQLDLLVSPWRFQHLLPSSHPPPFTKFSQISQNQPSKQYFRSQLHSPFALGEEIHRKPHSVIKRADLGSGFAFPPIPTPLLSSSGFSKGLQ